MKQAKRFVVRRFVKYHNAIAIHEYPELFRNESDKIFDSGYIWFYKQPKHKRSMRYLNWCKRHWFNVVKFYESEQLKHIETNPNARQHWRIGNNPHRWACNYAQQNMDLVQYQGVDYV